MVKRKPWSKNFMKGSWTEAERRKAWNLGLRKKNGRYYLKKR